MEEFTRLFGSLLTFVYQCFDRIVILGHLPLLTRPENIVHFFGDVHGIGPITKEVLRQRTTEYNRGSRLSPATTAFLSSGPRKACARKTTCGRTCGRWSASSVLVSISFSRAWRWGPTSAWRCRNIQAPTPTIGLWPGSARVTPITISTSATRCSDQLRYALAPSCRFRLLIISTVIIASNSNCAMRGFSFAKTITPSYG